MADFDELQCEVIGQLYQQKTATLLKLAEKLSVGLDKGQTRGKVIRAVRENIEMITDDADGVANLEQLLKDMDQEAPPTKHTPAQSTPELAQPVIEEVSKGVYTPLLQPTPMNAQPTMIYKKDLRISGQIGDPTQKDRISFSSLNHQMLAAKYKGYQDQEIVEAVLRAINPGLKLRSYLENYPNLTLDTLTTVLKTHYQERDATELYQELSLITQGKDETPQGFVMRALDLRQRIIRASAESTEGLQYDDALVRKMFLHAVVTGLENDSIRQDLKPLLRVDISDEVLLSTLNTAVALEAKRHQKTSRRPTRVTAIGEATLEKSEVKAKQSPQDNMFQAMAAQIAELKNCVAALQTKDHQSKDQRFRDGPRPRGCRPCRAAGQGDTCRHCFKCGGENHIARGCRGIRSYQGNANRAPQGDQE